MKKYVSIWLVVLVLLVGLTGCGGQKTESFDELISLGQKYLLEENYEEAIIAFEKALNLDKKRAEVYVGLADAYMGLGEEKQAIAVLEEGLALITDEVLRLLLEQIQNGEYVSYKDRMAKQKDSDEPPAEKGNEKNRIQKVESNKGYYWMVETDDQGKDIRYEYYDPQGTLFEVLVYEYDSNGYKTKEIVYDVDGTIICAWINENDSKGITQKILCYGENGENGENFGWIIPEYDAKGREIKQVEYSTDGEMTGYSTYEYDSEGNMSGGKSYHANGTQSNYWVLTYDEKGNMVSSLHYNADGTEN